MNIFIADPGADCFSPCPLWWLTRLLTSAVAGRVIILLCWKQPRLGPKVMSFWKRGRRKERRGSPWERWNKRVGVNKKKGDKAHESRLGRSWGYHRLERGRFIVYLLSWWMSFKLGFLSCVHFSIAESQEISKGPIKRVICIKSIWCKSAARCRLRIWACTRVDIRASACVFEANPALVWAWLFVYARRHV